jgi:hypothetical protein
LRTHPHVRFTPNASWDIDDARLNFVEVNLRIVNQPPKARARTIRYELGDQEWTVRAVPRRLTSQNMLCRYQQLVDASLAAKHTIIGLFCVFWRRKTIERK